MQLLAFMMVFLTIIIKILVDAGERVVMFDRLKGILPTPIGEGTYIRIPFMQVLIKELLINSIQRRWIFVQKHVMLHRAQELKIYRKYNRIILKIIINR